MQKLATEKIVIMLSLSYSSKNALPNLATVNSVYIIKNNMINFSFHLIKGGFDN